MVNSTVVSSDQLQNMVNTGQDLTYVVTSKVTDMGELFKDKQVIGDISTWDVSGVWNMTSTFEDTNVDIDISNWDVVIQRFNYMFKNSTFNGDISNWDVSL